jgi:large subunit ribosomal protein L10
MNEHREKPIPESKIKSVSRLVELFKSNKTVLVASIKNLPSSQFQEIRKNLRKEITITVPKKNIALRAIDNVKKGSLMDLKKQIKEDTAIIFSNVDAFELSAKLSSNRVRAKARSGQEAPEDIVIEPGPTDLLPGPAISELGALGIKIAIEGGKINIKEKKELVKSGGIITKEAADLMGKLDMKPMLLGFNPLAAYDSTDEKIYVGIKIDKEATLGEMKSMFGRALAFAVSISYTSEDTIKHLLAKASAHEMKLSSLVNSTENKMEETA